MMNTSHNDILNDDPMLGVVTRSIGPGGFHFEVHSRVIDDALAEGHHPDEGSASESVLRDSLERMPLVGDLIGHATLDQAVAFCGYVSYHLQGGPLRGSLPHNPHPQDDPQGYLWWFGTVHEAEIPII
jgi:hypothetical protein